MITNRRSALDFARDLSFAEIVTNPFLDIAARFWSADRYEAFQICYRSMRRIDDLVDDRKEVGEPLGADEKVRYIEILERWLDSVRRRSDPDPFQVEFAATLDRFAIPLWPWERLCHAMIYDLEHTGFKNLPAYLRYTEGAAVAPASVFMHLCGVRRTDTGFAPPAYDIRRAARPLAVFSYLVHIMRDFQKDQRRGLDYFAEDLLAEHDLKIADLRRIAESKGPVPDGFRRLMTRYLGFASYYQAKARRSIDLVKPHLEPRYQLSVEIIYGLYSLVHEQIDPLHGRFTELELQPAPDKVKARLEKIVAEFQAIPPS